MRTLITGAGGFVGHALLEALSTIAGPEEEFILADIKFGARREDGRLRYREAPLDGAGTIEALTAEPLDRVFHLATVAGVDSQNFDLGKATNLDATLALLEAVRGRGRPRFIYASSVGVFGAPLPPQIDDETLPTPVNSYGTHKLIGELMVSDYTRAGFIDGLALRFPGIIARPRGSVTMLSAFLNNIFYAARLGEPFEIPLAPEDGCWVMSLRRLVANLLHAGAVAADTLPTRRYWNLPVLLVRMQELVAALERVYGPGATAGFRFAPQAAVQRMFAQAPLHAPQAERLGFQGDGTLDRFVDNVIAGNPALAPAN